jgi:hypothetical protein
MWIWGYGKLVCEPEINGKDEYWVRLYGAYLFHLLQLWQKELVRMENEEEIKRQKKEKIKGEWRLKHLHLSHLADAQKKPKIRQPLVVENGKEENNTWNQLRSELEINLAKRSGGEKEMG